MGQARYGLLQNLEGRSRAICMSPPSPPTPSPPTYCMWFSTKQMRAFAPACGCAPQEVVSAAWQVMLHHALMGAMDAADAQQRRESGQLHAAAANASFCTVKELYRTVEVPVQQVRGLPSPCMRVCALYVDRRYWWWPVSGRCAMAGLP